MSDLYVCAYCRNVEQHAGSADSTDDGAFAKLREEQNGWKDIVARKPGLYVHAQFCSDTCALAWADNILLNDLPDAGSSSKRALQ